MNGIVSALTPPQEGRGRKYKRASQALLGGLLPVEKRAYNYERAMTALDTGDPRGLEALDFGSVRGPSSPRTVSDGSCRSRCRRIWHP